MCLDGPLMSLSAGNGTTLATCQLQETLSQSHVALFSHRKGWTAELGQGRVGLDMWSLQIANSLVINTVDWELSASQSVV